MLKKTIQYTNYNGEDVKKDFYFNLSKAEILEMEMSYPGGFAAMIQSVVDAKDAPQIMKIFKDLIKKAYGEKSADGEHFAKSEAISEAFTQTEAYSVLFMELVTDDKAAANFINAIVPVDMAQNNKPAIPAPPVK